MNRSDFVLAVLSTGNGDKFTPVQVQKLFFLIDKNIASLISGPFFNFIPWDYGPFDKEIYGELEKLASKNHIEICSGESYQSYRLTSEGQSLGKDIFEKLDLAAKKYIAKSSKFVRSLTFTQLVSAIYRDYPDMRAHSVFQG